MTLRPAVLWQASSNALASIQPLILPAPPAATAASSREQLRRPWISIKRHPVPAHSSSPFLPTPVRADLARTLRTFLLISLYSFHKAASSTTSGASDSRRSSYRINSLTGAVAGNRQLSERVIDPVG